MTDFELAMRFKAKALMRKRFRSHRASLPPSGAASRSAAICARLLGYLEGRTRVALFWPMLERKEVDLRPVHASLRERGADVAYPVVDPATDIMTFRRADTEGDLEPTAMGYLQPPLDAELLDDLEVVVVPGLAFDPRGHRIGYGGGFYDRALNGLAPRPEVVGVGYDFQLAADIPNTPGDVPVVRVFTDVRELVASSGA
ncbi:MAG: 5-formyltetrahydrofolate cyclo-ligase [Myxococcota bacterium]